LRLAIYSNAYRSRLEEALANDYSMLRKLLGDEAFSDVAQAYISDHPSPYFSLRWFGGRLAEHLGYDAGGGAHDWTAEMAQLENAFVNSFDARDVPIRSVEDATQVAPEDWPQLRMMFHPSVQVIGLWWNTVPRWRAAKRDEKPPVPQRLAQVLDCLLWREGLNTQYRTLEPLEAVVLRAAMQGEDFAELCGLIAAHLQSQEEVALRAVVLLKSWLAAGMITDLKT
jgi:hypothetical protein